MKVLFVNSTSKDAKKGYSSAIYPPLGILYLASVLKKAGHEVKVIDAFVLSIKKVYSYENLKKDIIEFKPDVLGVPCFTSNIEGSEIILDICKEVSPNTITIIGGPHITAIPESILKIPSADYGIYGEAEYIVLSFLEQIEKNQSIKNIPGIIYKENNKIQFQRGEYIKDIDELPFPAHELVPMNLYQPSPATYKQLPATTLITSRGCPFQCIFCHKPIFGNKFRPHSAKRVVDEIEYLNKNYGIKDIRIYDDTFTLDKKRVIDICNLLIERNLGITWNCTTRVDCIDKELLILMKRSGCYNISFGVESGSKRVLQLIKKGITKDRIRDVFKWTKEVGIESVGFFILGLPTQTKEEILETIAFAKEIDPDYVQFTLVNPHPDTELYELCKKKGKVSIGDFSNFKTYSSVDAELPFIPNTLTEKELKSLYKKAYISFYFRPKYINKRIKKILTDKKPIQRLKRGITTIFQRI